MAAAGDSGRVLTVVYDGDCPLCSAYVSRLRLQETVGRLELVNAREHPELVASLDRRGYRLNDGMVVMAGEQIYYGSQAIHVLALMSSRSGWFNRLNYWIFRSRTLATVLYPGLVAGRRLLLWLLGRSPLIAAKH